MRRGSIYGIIPACAGSSARVITYDELDRDHPRVCGEQEIRKSTSRDIGDHPRACGEQLTLVAFYFGRQGSSPRVRGAGSKVLHNAHIIGIIPARAGSRNTVCVAVELFGDHPRACGEQRGERGGCDFATGSSPRVRGAGGGLAEG